MTRLAAYTRQLDAGSSTEEEGEEGPGWEGEEEEEAPAAAPAAAVAQALAGVQLSPKGRAPAPPATVIESPDSAVRRLAAQRHAAMLEGSARAARRQHGRPTDLGLQELVLKETSVSARGAKLLLQPGSATSKSLRALDVSRCPNIGQDALDLHPRARLEVRCAVLAVPRLLCLLC